MRYHEFQPVPLLAKHIECFWVLEDEGTRSPSAPERLMPDGCVEMIINLGARFLEHKADGRSELQPTRIIVGQMTQPVLVSSTGQICLIGIRFTPGGSNPFIQIPPGELTNRVAPLGDIATSLDRDISNLLCETPGLNEKIAIIQSILINRLNQKTDRGISLHPVISRIVMNDGKTPIDRLASDLGITGRQLERRFLSEVGLSPKVLCRILRFQKVFRAVERADSNWAAVAADCGYYDQAHLIRDFRQFAGQTPAVLFDQFTTFTEFFTRKRRTSDFYNTSV